MANKKDWRKLLELFRILIRPFSWIFYLISGLIPRRKDIWVFGNVEKSVFVDKFADSSKYLFLEINEKYKDKIIAVWITSNKNTAKELAKHGYKAYTKWSTKGLYYTLKAKYWIFTHSYINPWLSRKSVKINLWHGIPLKKIMYDSKKGADYKRYVRLKNPFKKYIYFLLTPWMMEKTYYLATSPLVAKIFSSAFRTPINRVLISIYPRCKYRYRRTIEFTLKGGCSPEKRKEIEFYATRYSKFKIDNASWSDMISLEPYSSRTTNPADHVWPQTAEQTLYVMFQETSFRLLEGTEWVEYSIKLQVVNDEGIQG